MIFESVTNLLDVECGVLDYNENSGFDTLGVCCYCTIWGFYSVIARNFD